MHGAAHRAAARRRRRGARRACRRALDRAARRRLGRSLSIREVDAGSCNGCELEIHALNNAFYDLERFGLRFVASPRHADVLMVTGPVTKNMREALERTYDATPDPKWVVAVGDCAARWRDFRRQLCLSWAASRRSCPSISTSAAARRCRSRCSRVAGADGAGEGKSLEHDPEKCDTGFRKRSCSTNNLERDDDSKRSHHALENSVRTGFPSPAKRSLRSFHGVELTTENHCR